MAKWFTSLAAYDHVVNNFEIFTKNVAKLEATINLHINLIYSLPHKAAEYAVNPYASV